MFFSINFFTTYKLNFSKNSYRHQIYKSLSEVDSRIVNRALKIEDKRFYLHRGVDFVALARAIFENIKNWEIVQWASTIDQQVIKLNEQNFKNRWFKTKIFEILKAINLNFHYSKDQILLYWINNLEFLHQIKWFRSACKIYFWKECKDLFDSQLLFLFSLYQIWKDPFKERNFVLIKKHSQNLCRKVEDNKILCKNILQLPPESVKDLGFYLHKNYFLEEFSKLYPGKLQLKKDLYNKIEKIVDDTYDFRSTMWFQDCCIIVMNWSWKVLSMNLCRKPNDLTSSGYSWVNWCLRKRQTGSAIKPFLYIFAMWKLWWDENTIVPDKPLKFILNWNKLYIPKNFDLKYHWDVPLKIALWSSLNVPAIYTLNKVGVQRFLNFLTDLRVKLGENKEKVFKDLIKFNSERLWLSAALWTFEMSPYEFANLRRIFLIYKNLEDLPSSAVSQVYDILSDNKNRVLSFWIDNLLDIPWWAVKTWTSRHFIDWWTCWVNRDLDLIVCVWVWNYNWSPMKWSWIQTAGYLWNLIVSQLSN